MKKYIIAILALVLVFSFAACQPNNEANMTVEEETEEAGEQVKDEPAEAEEEKEVLRVGMDLQYPPFETFDENLEPIGISVDVAQGLADELGMELEVVNMDFGSLITALETGKIDIAIASMSITEEREEKVDFTEPYFYFKITGVMNKEYADANGLTSDSTAEELWAVTDTQFIGISGQISVSIPESYGFEVLEAVDKSSAITEVALGRADILVMSAEVVADAHNANPDSTILFNTPLDVSPIGMAVAEGNTELLEAANEYIAHLDDEGGIYDQLRVKYLETMQEKFGPDATLDIYIYED